MSAAEEEEAAAAPAEQEEQPPPQAEEAEQPAAAAEEGEQPATAAEEPAEAAEEGEQPATAAAEAPAEAEAAAAEPPAAEEPGQTEAAPASAAEEGQPAPAAAEEGQPAPAAAEEGEPAAAEDAANPPAAEEGAPEAAQPAEPTAEETGAVSEAAPAETAEAAAVAEAPAEAAAEEPAPVTESPAVEGEAAPAAEEAPAPEAAATEDAAPAEAGVAAEAAPADASEVDVPTPAAEEPLEVDPLRTAPSAAEASGTADMPAAGDSFATEATAGEAAIDFVILPEGYGQTKPMAVQRLIGEIRAELENELSIPENSLYLMNMTGAVEKNDVLPDDKTLADLGVKGGDKLGIELRINYYQEQPVEDYVMPDTLELRVVDAKGIEKTVVVHVQRPVVEKAYLGGYKNKLSNSHFHHAVTQTAPMQKKEIHMIRFHREVQTYEYRTRSTQCTKENGTQMPKPGLYISTVGDKLMTPRKPYFSSADKAALVTEMCVIIQCHARGMFARRRARQKKSEKKDREELEQKESERRRLEADLKHKREIERRMHPRTYDDFAVLQKELEAWRLNEASRIANSTFDEGTRRQAHKELLQKQTKLLQTIDKLRIKAHGQNRDAKIKKKLESMSKPKVWAQADGETTTVHTPFSTRAKELMDLYSGLRLPLLTVDERLDVLLHVKWTVKEFDCNLTREIVDLIDREADMLNRGRPEKSFVGLRKRLANLFLQFAETPEFNPEALRFQKVSREVYDQGSNHPLSTVLIKGLP
mmetsp:Transcript_64017/g.152666  ORF Transcript_64017/g.152666 Transcript_64017/m.152666 type:complete len:757 (+) Transcript_64017:61-2331(+)